MIWFLKILSTLILLGKVKYRIPAWPWVLIPMFPLGSRAHWHKWCPLWISWGGLRGHDRRGAHSHSGTQLHQISPWGAELRSRFTSGGGDMDIWEEVWCWSVYSSAPWVTSFLPETSLQVFAQQMLSWDVTMEVVRSPGVVGGKLEIDSLLLWKGTRMFISKAVVIWEDSLRSRQHARKGAGVAWGERQTNRPGFGSQV